MTGNVADALDGSWLDSLSAGERPRRLSPAAFRYELVERARAAGWEPVNGDLTVVAEAPRLAPFVVAMAEALTNVLGAPVSVKATRAEGLGSIGRAEGIACLAVVLLRPTGGAT